MSPAVWRVVAQSTPRILRRCARCDQVRPFRSSDRFRVNANGRKLDVWLVYRCDACGVSWNRTLLERRTPEEIGVRFMRWNGLTFEPGGEENFPRHRRA